MKKSIGSLFTSRRTDDDSRKKTGNTIRTSARQILLISLLLSGLAVVMWALPFISNSEAAGREDLAVNTGPSSDDIELSFVVTNTNDSGAGSLRQAVLDSNTAAGSDTITFDPAVFSSPQTITLASVITINPATGDSLTITGPGANMLTVSGNNAVRIFALSAGDTAMISGMTLTQAVTGAIGNAGNLTVTNMTFNANTNNGGGGDGGAIGNRQALSLTVTGCAFTNNTGTAQAGGAAINFNSFNTNPTATITNTTFTNNSAIGGAVAGAIFINNGMMTITGSTFTGNGTNNTGDGGAIAIQGGQVTQVTINNSVLTGNSSTRSGGAIYYQPNGGTPVLAINNSTISNNISNSDSDTFGGGGGGLYLADQGSVTIMSSTINGNISNTGSAATGLGGGIYVGVPMTMTNSTVSGNTAQRSGGGIYTEGTSTRIVNLTNSTIVNNTATINGGGISATSSNPVNIRNSIFANNTANGGTSPDILGTVNSNGFNLIKDTTGATINGATATNIIGQDPLLGPLQDNGGMTFTHALLVGSPAIDKGESSGSTTDQRIQTRPVDNPNITNAAGGDGADIGAFEIQPVLQFSTATYSISEGGGVATITVNRINGSEGIDTVMYATSDGTATGGASCGGGVDYQSAVGNLDL